MKKTPFLNVEDCLISNDLWCSFINQIGLYKARLAVRQALDLQRMQGNINTLPVLILETCGSALVSSEIIKTYIGLSCKQNGMILIYSTKLNSIQLLKDN
tara:strand:+ start:1059 stop:1358 length:300 start_codon:yes stop_codon:yes gene_type:complete